MSFVVEDFQDLVRLLQQKPELRAELRHFLLADDLLELPRITRELAEAQRSTDVRIDQLAQHLGQLTQRVDQLTERLDQLTQRVDQLTERLDQLTERVDQLAQRLDQLTERVDQLAQRLDQLTERVDQLAQRLDQLALDLVQLADGLKSLTAQVRLLTGEVGELKGSDLERRYRERAPAYFARLMKRIHALSSEELADLIDEALERGVLTEAEREELLNTDVVVRGVWRQDGRESFLAVEVSVGVGTYDVERAARRAALLEKLTGKPCFAVVAGEAITAEAERAAYRLRAWRVLDGRAVAPDESQTR